MTDPTKEELAKSPHEIAVEFAERFQDSYPIKEPIFTLLDDLRIEIEKAIQSACNRKDIEIASRSRALRKKVELLEKYRPTPVEAITAVENALEDFRERAAKEAHYYAENSLTARFIEKAIRRMPLTPEDQRPEKGGFYEGSM